MSAPDEITCPACGAEEAFDGERPHCHFCGASLALALDDALEALSEETFYFARGEKDSL